MLTFDLCSMRQKAFDWKNDLGKTDRDGKNCPGNSYKIVEDSDLLFLIFQWAVRFFFGLLSVFSLSTKPIFEVLEGHFLVQSFYICTMKIEPLANVCQFVSYSFWSCRLYCETTCCISLHPSTVCLACSTSVYHCQLLPASQSSLSSPCSHKHFYSPSAYQQYFLRFLPLSFLTLWLNSLYSLIYHSYFHNSLGSFLGFPSIFVAIYSFCSRIEHSYWADSRSSIFGPVKKLFPCRSCCWFANAGTENFFPFESTDCLKAIHYNLHSGQIQLVQEASKKNWWVHWLLLHRWWDEVFWVCSFWIEELFFLTYVQFNFNLYKVNSTLL